MPCRSVKTRNTEYRLVGDLCVDVRDLVSGQPLPGHAAVGQRLLGCLTMEEGGRLGPVSRELRLGACLLFRTPVRDVLTTPLVDIQS